MQIGTALSESQHTNVISSTNKWHGFPTENQYRSHSFIIKF